MTEAAPLGRAAFERWLKTNGTRARTMFDDGHYENALDLYRNLVKEVERVYSLTNPKKLDVLITLLDTLALVSHKAGHSKEGIRAALKIIKINSKLAKGHLRKAKIETALGMLDDAAETCRIAVKHCRKAEDPIDYDRLLNFSLQLKQTAMKQQHCHRPDIVDLPFEIQQMVFGYIPYEQLIRCTRVCRGWREAILRNPYLRSTIDLSAATKRPWTKTHLDALFEKVECPRRLIIPRSRYDFKVLLQHVMKHESWKELHVLSQNAGEQLPNWGESPLTSLFKCNHEAGMPLNLPFLCERPLCQEARSMWRNIEIVKDESSRIWVHHLERLFRLCPNLKCVEFQAIFQTSNPQSFPGFYKPESFSDLPKPPFKSFKLRCLEDDLYNFRYPDDIDLGPTRPHHYATPILNFVLDRGAETLVELTFGGISCHYGQRGYCVDFSGLKKLRHLNLIGGECRQPIRVPESLESFFAQEFVFGGNQAILVTDTTQDIQRFPELRKFVLRDCFSELNFLSKRQDVDVFRDECEEWWALRHTLSDIVHTNNGNLKKLGLNTIKDFDELEHIVHTGIFQSLTQLAIVMQDFDNGQWSRSIFSDLVQSLPNCTSLTIGSDLISSFEIKAFVNNMKSLKSINYQGCPRVTSDVKEWLRRKKIAFKSNSTMANMNDYSSRARRVRFGDN